MRLKDKVAIVTGGGSGIGRAIALRFAREGASILVADVNTEGALATVRVIEAEKGRASFISTDVTQPPDVQAMVDQALSFFGKLDILVNNAGGSKGDALAEMDEATWQWNFDLNVKSVYLCCRVAIPKLLVSPGGNVVNISTVNALFGIGGDAYSAAKAALINLTQNIAVRYGPQGLRANVICPGTVASPAWQRRVEADPGLFDRVSKLYPLRRVAHPDDIANAALFLASDEASFITGAVLAVDGGLTAGTDRFRRAVAAETV